jgi:hypothetical protein
LHTHSQPTSQPTKTNPTHNPNTHTHTITQLRDPVLRHYPGEPLSSPQAVLMCALVSLYSSFMFFAQSVRLYVHWGFYCRAATSEFGGGAVHTDDAKLVVIR